LADEEEHRGENYQPKALRVVPLDEDIGGDACVELVGKTFFYEKRGGGEREGHTAQHAASKGADGED
jgi:hypothetical protein